MTLEQQHLRDLEFRLEIVNQQIARKQYERRQIVEQLERLYDRLGYSYYQQPTLREGDEDT